MRTPDRVVFLTNDFRPRLGGVADHLHRLADSLNDRVPVTVMSTVSEGATPWPHAYRFEQLPPLPNRRLGERFGDGLPLARKLHTGLFFAALHRGGQRAVARIAPRSGERVVAIVGIWDTAAHFWCTAARRAALPYLVCAHGVEIVIPLYGGLPEWRRRDFADADGVISNSRATAALVRDRLSLAPQPFVIHPSVGPRPSREQIAPAAEALRRRAAITDGPVILSLGRLIARKGFDLVLRAVAELRRDLPNLTYLIAGDGYERTRLENLSRDLDLKNHVRFLGAVDDETKWAAYDLCDLFVMPNRLLDDTDFEGFGIVFLEAALSGKPAIGGRTGGAGEAIVDETTGLLVDPEGEGSVARAIHRLLADRALRLRLGAAACEWARTTHTGRHAADQLWAHLGGEA